MKPRLLSERELNTIRGKASVGHATQAEIMQVFGHIDVLESRLDEADQDDALGTECWRHFVGIPE